MSVLQMSKTKGAHLYRPDLYTDFVPDCILVLFILSNLDIFKYSPSTCDSFKTEGRVFGLSYLHHR